MKRFVPVSVAVIAALAMSGCERSAQDQAPQAVAPEPAKPAGAAQDVEPAQPVERAATGPSKDSVNAGEGPDVAAAPPEPKKVEGPPQDAYAVDVVEWYFGKAIASATKRLKARMEKIDRAAYRAFLEEHKAKAAKCDEPEPEMAALLAKYQSAQDAESEASFLAEIRKRALAAENPQLDCIAARTAKVDDQGVFLAGLLVDKKEKGEDLKPTVPSPGKVFLLAPQIVTAWPGRADSALSILDPRQAPWKVRAASSYQEKVETFSRAWTQKNDIGLQEFLDSRISTDYFLLVDETEAAVGWISANDCTFYQTRWSVAADNSTPFFVKGVASMLQGIHYTPEARCDSRGHCPDVRVFDFITMTQGRLMPGPKTRDMALSRLRDLNIKAETLLERNYFTIIIEQNADSSKTAGDDFKYYDLPISLSAPRAADASLLHVEMTKVPIERLTSLW